MKSWVSSIANCYQLMIKKSKTDFWATQIKDFDLQKVKDTSEKWIEENSERDDLCIVFLPSLKIVAERRKNDDNPDDIKWYWRDVASHIYHLESINRRPT